jgi:hypothetical protein
VKPKGPKPRPSSGYYGVSADQKRWKAQIGYGGKKHNLGRFDAKQEAALAYDREARQCGKDKLLNYESNRSRHDWIIYRCRYCAAAVAAAADPVVAVAATAASAADSAVAAA